MYSSFTKLPFLFISAKQIIIQLDLVIQSIKGKVTNIWNQPYIPNQISHSELFQFKCTNGLIFTCSVGAGTFKCSLPYITE